MPLIKSAKKSLKVANRRKAENALIKDRYKKVLKEARLAVAEKTKDVDKKIAAAYHELDTAAKKHVIHKNKAARLKSRLAKKLAQPAEIKTVKKVKKTAK